MLYSLHLIGVSTACILRIDSHSFVQSLNAMTVAESVLGTLTRSNQRGGTAECRSGHLQTALFGCAQANPGAVPQGLSMARKYTFIHQEMLLAATHRWEFTLLI